MFTEDQRFGILAHVFRGPRVFGSWLMFSEDFWALVHVFRGPKVWDLGSCFQRTKGFFGSWLMFSEDLGFLGFGSCF